MNSKYIFIRNKAYATAIAWVTNESFYTLTDYKDENKKIYSFVNSEKIKNSISKLNNLKDENKI